MPGFDQVIAPQDIALPARREPDDSRVFAVLLKLGLEPADAYAFVQDPQDLAAEYLIVRFESKLEAQVARLESRLAEQAGNSTSLERKRGALTGPSAKPASGSASSWPH